MKRVLQRGVTMSPWTQSIIDSLEQGMMLSDRAMELVIDMCGKASGRRNSKKYLDSAKKAQDAFDRAIAAKLNIKDGKH